MMIDFDTIGSKVARDLVIVLNEHDSPTLENLYYYMKKYWEKKGRKWKKSDESTIRCTIQRHCRTCDQYQNKHDLFEHLDNGCWRLRPELKWEVLDHRKVGEEYGERSYDH
ncbi:MAG TPA: hypothetical protein VGE97_08875 [Nitrososphaera sp.]|jgi:hypothetical protein